MVAFGGNALLKRGEPLTTDVQRRNAQAASQHPPPPAAAPGARPACTLRFVCHFQQLHRPRRALLATSRRPPRSWLSWCWKRVSRSV